MLTVSFPNVGSENYRLLVPPDWTIINAVAESAHKIERALMLKRKNPHNLGIVVKIHHHDSMKDRSVLSIECTWQKRKFAELRFKNGDTNGEYVPCHVWRTGSRFKSDDAPEVWTDPSFLLTPPLELLL